MNANGTYTINSKRGGYRTFMIKTNKKKGSRYEGTRELFLLNGPDNVRNYSKIGFVKSDGTFYAWGSEEMRHVVGLLEAKIKNTDHKWADRCELLESRTCRRCNRKLTTPDSIEKGLGPICEGLESEGH